MWNTVLIFQLKIEKACGYNNSQSKPINFLDMLLVEDILLNRNNVSLQ